MNRATGEQEAPLTAAEFELIPGVEDGLRRLQRDGFLLFLVSNQPNYAKGKSSLEEILAIHTELRRKLEVACVEFAAFYYCFHHPEGMVAGHSGPCVCRKPSPYFLLMARTEFDIDLEKSWMIGDRATDVLCGHAAGTRTILIDANGTGASEITPDLVVADLAAATDYICGAATRRLPELQIKAL